MSSNAYADQEEVLMEMSADMDAVKYQEVVVTASGIVEDGKVAAVDQKNLDKVTWKLNFFSEKLRAYESAQKEKP